MENTKMIAKPVAADIMEGGEKVKGNRTYAQAKSDLAKTYNPDSVRQLDTVAMHFLDRHVFARETNHDGKDNGKVVLAFTAGCYLSNIEKELVDRLELDTELQTKYRDALVDAGYTSDVMEAEPEAKILDTAGVR